MTNRWTGRAALLVSVMLLASTIGIFQSAAQATPLLAIGVDAVSGSVTQVSFTYAVTNHGGGQATNVRVSNAVPSDTTFEQSTPPPAAPSGGGTPTCENGGFREPSGTTCEWDLGTLAPGETKSVLATFNLNQADAASYTVGGTAGNTASVRSTETGTSAADSDSDTSVKRDRIVAAASSDDTFVNEGETADTVHGTCNELQIARGNAITSFLDLEGLPTNPENFWGAQLRLTLKRTDYQAPAPGSVGVHRITTGEWSQGAGGCPGGTLGSGTDARKGSKPQSAASPTATAAVNKTLESQQISWDVTPDLDGTDDRATYQGWEIKDQGTAGPDRTEFHSKEAAEAQRPRMFIVYTVAEAATCVDADPDEAFRNSSSEHIFQAVVTDGAKLSEEEGPDACNGAPTSGQVVWELEDDAPDAFFSQVNGQPTAGQPNTVESATDSQGRTTTGLRLVAPSDSTKNSGANTVSARLKDAADPEDEPECMVPPPDPEVDPCVHENAVEDDMVVNWSPQTTESPQPTQTPTATSTTTTSPTATSTTTTSPTGTQSATRTVTLVSSSQTATAGNNVTFSGQIISSNQSCEDNEFIRLLRRVHGTSTFIDYRSTNTGPDGGFQIVATLFQNAEYIAFAPGHDNCADGQSDPEEVLVAARVTARSNKDRPDRGSQFKIKGRVSPNHEGTDATLMRRRRGRFIEIGTDELNNRSRFVFELDADFKKRTFKVVWKKQDERNQRGESDSFRVRTKRN